MGAKSEKTRGKQNNKPKKLTEPLPHAGTLVLNKAESQRFIQALERDFVPPQALLNLMKTRRHDIIELV